MFGAPVASLPWLEPFVTDSERPWREWTDIAWQNWFQDVSDKSVTQLIFQLNSFPSECVVRSKVDRNFFQKLRFKTLEEFARKRTNTNRSCHFTFVSCSTLVLGETRLSEFLSRFLSPPCASSFFFGWVCGVGPWQDLSHPFVSRILSEPNLLGGIWLLCVCCPNGLSLYCQFTCFCYWPWCFYSLFGVYASARCNSALCYNPVGRPKDLWAMVVRYTEL